MDGHDSEQLRGDAASAHGCSATSCSHRPLRELSQIRPSRVALRRPSFARYPGYAAVYPKWSSRAASGDQTRVPDELRDQEPIDALFDGSSDRWCRGRHPQAHRRREGLQHHLRRAGTAHPRQSPGTRHPRSRRARRVAVARRVRTPPRGWVRQGRITQEEANRIRDDVAGARGEAEGFATTYRATIALDGSASP